MKQVSVPTNVCLHDHVSVLAKIWN